MSVHEPSAYTHQAGRSIMHSDSQYQRPDDDGNSFFHAGSSAQIIDSPATSPMLGPQRSPTQYGGSDAIFAPRGSNRAHALSKIAARRRDGSTETPAASEVPSLSLSHSSASDSYLLSPYHEAPPPSYTNSSISSVRTIKAPGSGLSRLDEQDAAADVYRLDAISRAAAVLRTPVEEVYRAVNTIKSLQQRNFASMDEDIPDHDNLQRIYEVVQAEEDRLRQIASFRAAYVQAESKRSKIELRHHVPPPLSAGLPGLSSPRMLPPLSPGLPYEHSDPTIEDGRRPPHINTSSHTIPSAREALEILADTRHDYEHTSPISPMSRFPPSSYAFNPINGHAHHVRRSSGSRPLSMPDRSYRSMDDYVNDSQQSSSSSSNSLRAAHHSIGRRSMQAPYPHPSLSRPSSRSPLNAGESPQLNGSDALAFSPGSKRASVTSSPLLSTSNSRLQPNSLGPHRRRSGSTTSNQSNLSRRTSTDLLGLGLPRSISPSVAESGSSVGLSHEEVMARLQRKVRERLAAREASGDVSASIPTSPAVDMQPALSNGGLASPGGGGGRRRQGSTSIIQSVISAAQRSPSKTRKPRKSASLKALPQSEYRLEDKPLPPLPVNDDQDAHTAQKSDQQPPMSPTVGLSGIEALLSAAAIADGPRH